MKQRTLISDDQYKISIMWEMQNSIITMWLLIQWNFQNGESDISTIPIGQINLISKLFRPKR